jgi:hypothetical protein
MIVQELSNYCNVRRKIEKRVRGLRLSQKGLGGLA